jgi:hypothetical protein
MIVVVVVILGADFHEQRIGAHIRCYGFASPGVLFFEPPPALVQKGGSISKN